MDSDEWPTWRAMALIDPFDDDRLSYLLAEVASLTYNLHADTSKHGPRKPSDFLPFVGTREATLSEVDAGGIAIDSRLRTIRMQLLRDSD